MQSLARTSLRSSVGASRALSTSVLLRAGGQDGATASSKTFSAREKSQEEQYVQQKEREQYRLAKAKLDAQKKKLMDSGVSEKDLAEDEAKGKK